MKAHYSSTQYKLLNAKWLLAMALAHVNEVDLMLQAAGVEDDSPLYADLDAVHTTLKRVQAAIDNEVTKG